MSAGTDRVWTRQKVLLSILAALVLADLVVFAAYSAWSRQGWRYASAEIQEADAIRQSTAEPQKRLNSLPPPPPESAPFEELVQWIRPRPGEEQWLQMPWQTSLLKASAVARRTNRLLFIWATNDPLGRC